MVATEERTSSLTTDEWASLSIPAACANRPKHIPENQDRFKVQRSPHQLELAHLMPVLDKAGVYYAVRQAAVWIVTDNANYDDLGILVASQYGFGGDRVINAQETARAMQICDEAGVGVKQKAIWKNRKQIVSELADGELKKWLEQKISEQKKK
jgi:hypothetical protein